MNNYEMLDDFNCKVNCCKEKNRNNINGLRSFSVSIYLYLFAKWKITTYSNLIIYF